MLSRFRSGGTRWTTDLAAAYERCRELHKRHGRTYYLATRLLPAWKRRHVHALYGFTRYADEIVDRTDDAAPGRARPPGSTEWSERFVAGLRGEPVDDPLLPAVLHTIAVFDLDRRRLRLVPAQHGDGPDGHVLRRPTTTCSTTWRARRR